MNDDLEKAIAEANPILQDPELPKLLTLHEAIFDLLNKLGLSPSTLGEEHIEHVKDFMNKVSKL